MRAVEHGGEPGAKLKGRENSTGRLPDSERPDRIQRWYWPWCLTRPHRSVSLMMGDAAGLYRCSLEYLQKKKGEKKTRSAETEARRGELSWMGPACMPRQTNLPTFDKCGRLLCTFCSCSVHSACRQSNGSQSRVPQWDLMSPFSLSTLPKGHTPKISSSICLLLLYAFGREQDWCEPLFIRHMRK